MLEAVGDEVSVVRVACSHAIACFLSHQLSEVGSLSKAAILYTKSGFRAYPLTIGHKLGVSDF
ncbi:hypothetical protein Poly24_38170 [Rosistilla carotiformis]|uniref:Uncharacterized protein n=1 Tax=Rosistilla carotiformis TaxID=2528017 RepID=A0A518JX34_9BACT|nr:hypothetical protein Poly24_38170 [Rosistilla carotiformis]